MYVLFFQWLDGSGSIKLHMTKDNQNKQAHISNIYFVFRHCSNFRM